ncbi:MAG: helicase-exonuclease AddAB subunit AddA [Oscillospiraceae bacterium]|jgi:ATP-dependent helicase/nuclease subunit A|nr:helicase-exonuclease AddAB subunit AddA [Oscillospiraceae bacterium]
MSSFNATPQQKAAIEHRGGTLLISAGAGSGKTRVLVERLMSRVLDASDPCDISDFLIITFTRAAAAELRDRIRRAVTDAIADAPDNARLRRQSRLVASAEIGTIHSFCARIVRENAHILGIAPDFRVADESETAAWRASVVRRTLENRYAVASPEFLRLVDALSPGRDDSALHEIVLKTYTNLMANPDPDDAAARAIGDTDFADASETRWGASLLDDARDTAEMWRARMSDVSDELAESPENARFFDAVAPIVAQLGSFIAACGDGWDSALIAANFDFPRLPSVKGGAPEFLKHARDECKKALQSLAKLFDATSDEHRDDIAATSEILRELFDVTREFRELYDAEKLRRRALDFTDLEHLALRLLRAPDGAQSPLAQELSRRYREVMVDEYQDVSSLQDTLARLVSGGGRRLTTVGDARQSIYRFRLANPRLFLDRYESLPDELDANGGRRVVLAENFRSRGSVVAAVNDVFENVMSRRVGDLDYTARERLIAGRSDADGGASVRLQVIDATAIEVDEDGESDDALALESRHVASQIREMIERGTVIPDEETGARAARYSDVAIILRSRGQRAAAFRESLETLGIPVDDDSRDDFFARHEVELALAFLSIIDNPRQDVPLAAVMSSQVYAFTSDELAAARNTLKSGDFYDAVRAHAETDAHCRAFLAELSGFRALARDMAADELLWHVFDATGLLVNVSAWEDGTARRRNLTRLAELCREFEERGYVGISAFLTHVERLRERGISPSAPEREGVGVKIMTIHRSKGLEFPIVFLPSLHKRFNFNDEREPIVFHPELGAGVRRVDPLRRLEYPTLPRLAIERRLRAETVSEELRLLYVAMTRAREHLILSSCLTRNSKKPQSLEADATAPVPPNVVGARSDLASMVYLALLSRPEGTRLIDPTAEIQPYRGMWDIAVIDPSDIPDARKVELPQEFSPPQPLVAPPEPFVYPHERAVTLPSKLTVTELRGAKSVETAEDAQSTAPSGVADDLPYRRPDFVLETAPLTGSEHGTAVHNVMLRLDYARCGTLDDVRAELARLVADGVVDPKALRDGDDAKIAAFFGSDIGKIAIAADAEHRTMREFKFSLLRRADEVWAEAGGDLVLFQGVVDLAIDASDALIIVDFKTDRTRSDTAIAEKTAQYTYQIREYAAAMTRVTGKPVSRGGLYFLDSGTWSEVTL